MVWSVLTFPFAFAHVRIVLHVYEASLNGAKVKFEGKYTR